MCLPPKVDECQMPGPSTIRSKSVALTTPSAGRLRGSLIDLDTSVIRNTPSGCCRRRWSRTASSSWGHVSRLLDSIDPTGQDQIRDRNSSIRHQGNPIDVRREHSREQRRQAGPSHADRTELLPHPRDDWNRAGWKRGYPVHEEDRLAFKPHSQSPVGEALSTAGGRVVGEAGTAWETQVAAVSASTPRAPRSAAAIDGNPSQRATVRPTARRWLWGRPTDANPNVDRQDIAEIAVVPVSVRIDQ